jgi:hypothetical protein
VLGCITGSVGNPRVSHAMWKIQPTAVNAGKSKATKHRIRDVLRVRRTSSSLVLIPATAVLPR